MRRATLATTPRRQLDTVTLYERRRSPRRYRRSFDDETLVPRRRIDADRRPVCVSGTRLFGSFAARGAGH